MEFMNLTLIGTSHIARESINEIKSFIEEQKPEIVALELDKNRFLTLTSKKKQKTDFFAAARIGLNGLVFLVLGQWAQKALGKLVGVKPGSEMLTAIKLAKKHGLAIALIDQDIQVTLKRFSTTLPLKERIKVLIDIIKGVLFRENELKKMGIPAIDLTRVPDEVVVQQLIGLVRQRYPNIYRVLVEERNVVMARNLASIMKANPDKKILAVIGAGHEADLMELIRLYIQHIDIVTSP
jgi:pheromone shutdown-related protein TraB